MSSSPQSQAPKENDPQGKKPRARACAGCHLVKHKCVKSDESQPACDRCIRLDMECVPHISRQGQRTKKDKAQQQDTIHSAPSIPAAGAEQVPNNLDRCQLVSPSPANSKEPASTKAPQRGACTRCHKSKHKCKFAEGQTKCDRCIKAGKECVPRVSRQGQRKKKPEEEGTAEDEVAATMAPSTTRSSAENGVEDNTGINNRTNQAHDHHYSLTQGRLASINETRLRKTPGAAAITAEQANYLLALVQDNNEYEAQDQVGDWYDPGFCDDTYLNDTSDPAVEQPEQAHPIVANIESSLSIISIPLRQWIKGALTSTGMRWSNHCSSSPISPKYIESCLQIAVSLANHISEAEEELSIQKLSRLPFNIADWASDVAVNVKDDRVNSSDRCAARMPSSLALAAELKSDRLEDLLDSICEDDAEEVPFLNVYSAQFLTSSTNVDSSSDKKSAGLLSLQQKNDRIIALGRVFYELFSGGQLPPPEVLSLTISQDRVTSPGSDLASMLKLDEEQDVDYSGNSNGTASRKRVQEPQSLLRTHVDSLQPLGLPFSLCNCIYNLLDVINCDFSGDDAYKSMNDVASDLQLMIERPAMYLHDLDVAHLSSAGLQLNDNLTVRSKEYESLKCVYHRVSGGSSEMALISGISGTGKSYLAQRLSRHIISSGGMYLYVKFDQMKRSNSLSVLVVALNEYCTALREQKYSVLVQSLAAKLQNSLGQELQCLVKTLPNLSGVIGCYASDDASDQDYVNGEKKIIYLLTRFIEALSACSGQTVTLCFDDLQWASNFSLAVLEQIMLTPGDDTQFFVIGCYRDDEMASDHPSMKTIVKLREHGIAITTEHLDCMDKVTVNEMISQVLCLPGRLVNSLSDVCYHKTQGNPLFLSRLLLSLNKDGLLRFSLEKHRWIWDEETIQARSIPDDVAAFISSTIGKCTPDVQEALCVLSCFGSAVPYKTLETLGSRLGLQLVGKLEIAASEGFLNKLEDKFYWSHDRVQESVFSLIGQDELCRRHCSYGMCLVNDFRESGDTDMLFAGISLINLAGPLAITDASQFVDIAQHNYIAGKKALDMSAFAAASSFFNNGLSFLSGRAQANHYNLALGLYESAAQCSLILGDHAHLASLADQVDIHATCIEDKLNVALFLLKSFIYGSKLPEAVSKGLSILTQLSVNLPTNLSNQETLSLIRQTQYNLAMISDANLLGYKQMTDTRHLMAMKYLAMLELPAFIIAPALQPIVTLTMINMTIENGISPMTPVGLAWFAGHLTKIGEMSDAFRFAKLAKTLGDRIGCREIAGNVIWITSEVLYYNEPMQSVNEYRVHGQDVAMSSGDVHFVCVLKVMYCANLQWNGTNLLTAKKAFSHAAQFTKSQNHLQSYHSLIGVNRSILMLLGEADESESYLPGDNLNNPHQLLSIYFQEMIVSLIFNNYNDLKYSAEKFFDARLPTWSLNSIHSAHEFYGGLAAFRIYRQTRDTLWLERGMECRKVVQFWKEQGSRWNWEHRHWLLVAEENFCHMNFADAEAAYNVAITSARSHKFINDEALAHELVGHFYLNEGMIDESRQHFASAFEKYIEWGANAKVNMIFDFIQEKFGVTTAGLQEGNPLSADDENTQKRRYHN